MNVRLGMDSGLRVAVLEGLSEADEVIRRPGAHVVNGVEVVSEK